MTDSDKKYLGDGVYASIENGMLKLETERDNGTHYIYLESEVMVALLRGFPRLVQFIKEKL